MEKINLLFIIILLFYASQVSGQAKSILDPPQIISNPENIYKYSPHSRRFSGISSLAVTPSGRIWVTWYAGITPNEDANNYVVLATSIDGGDSWEEVLIVDPDGRGPVRAFDPEIWIAPDNSLWLFWAQHTKETLSKAGVWAIRTFDIENASPDWSSPMRLTDGVMMCKPLVLSDGDWLLPVSTWRYTNESAKVVASSDNGKTWVIRGACDVPEEYRIFDEHMLVEKKDSSLWMLVRTTYGIGESFSEDKGKTWSKLMPSLFEHTSSRFFIRRLISGNLLLVKHGPIQKKTGRNHLMAFISKDDGKTWSRGLLLDERLQISYPDGQQTADGYIHLTYDYSRRGEQLILYTKFKEEDILSENYDSKIIEVFNQRRIISKGGQ
ncbi:MAG: glycoside hydrolase [Tannerella sp.]|jgi:predicted neuraminidase|nr:glycoside hydrolase [Tannerella sp.]